MHDLRYAFRLIRQNWGFSLTVIAILALCIGANTAVLAVVDGAMLRPLPYPQPDRLMQVVVRFQREAASSAYDSHDGRSWFAIRDGVPAVEAAVYSDWITGVNLGVAGNGVYVRQQRVAAGFFHVLGVRPLVGREFIADEDRSGGAAAVVLSHALWHKYFHDDPTVVGRGVLLRGEPFTVVGVMPAGFRTDSKADLWTPLRPSTTGEGSGSNYVIIARLKDGATRQQASAQLNSLVPELKKAGVYGKDVDVRREKQADVSLDVIPMLEGVTSDLRQPLMLLWGAVGFVFILGCVNIGGMLLARASGRIGEIATRLALGAPFSRIVRQLLIESTALGLLGGLAGRDGGLGGAGRAARVRRSDISISRNGGTRLAGSGRHAAVDAGRGHRKFFWPASPRRGYRQRRRRSCGSAQSGSRGVAGRKRFISLGALVGGQVALTVPLLFGAGLFLHTFLYLWNLSPGFDPNHVMFARFSLEDARYKTSAKMNQLYDKALLRLHETPGIEAAAVSLTLPYERALNEGVRIGASDRVESTNLTYVTPELFTALRIPVLQGRVFSPADGPDSANVVVVNDAFVKRYLKNGEPVGQSIKIEGQQRAIVGIVGDVLDKRAGWGNYGPVGRIPMVYMPAAQFAGMGVHIWFSPKWVVRSSLDGAQVVKAIEDATRAADPLLPMAAFQSVRDLKTDALTFQRFLAVLAGAIAALAMILSAMGIYGLISNLVTERTKELGIRMALGSGVGFGPSGSPLRPGLPKSGCCAGSRWARRRRSDLSGSSKASYMECSRVTPSP